MKSQFLIRMKVRFQNQVKEIGAHSSCWKDLNEKDLMEMVFVIFKPNV